MTTAFKLGQRSIANLVGVHPKLVAVVTLALRLSEVDFTVIEGLRTAKRQRELYDQGRTKPGPKVTWTMNSKHLPQADGYGHAVDLAHIKGGEVIWTDCDKIAKAMMDAAEHLSVGIRWGADWDRDGKPRERGETDSPHFELA